MKRWAQWGYKTKLLYFSFQIKWGHVNIWFMNFAKSKSHLCSFSAFNILSCCSFANELFATELEQTAFSQKTEGRPNDSCKHSSLHCKTLLSIRNLNILQWALFKPVFCSEGRYNLFNTGQQAHLLFDMEGSTLSSKSITNLPFFGVCVCGGGGGGHYL